MVPYEIVAVELIHTAFSLMLSVALWTLVLGSLIALGLYAAEQYGPPVKP